MSAAPPLQTIPVGVVVERTKAMSAWVDHLWRVSAVLAGVPDTPLWSKLSDRRRARDILCGRGGHRTASHRNDELPQQSCER